MWNRSRNSGKLLAVMVALLSSAIFFSPASPGATSIDGCARAEKPQIQDLYSRLPLQFIANQGQAPSQVKFY